MSFISNGSAAFASPFARNPIVFRSLNFLTARFPPTSPILSTPRRFRRPAIIASASKSNTSAAYPVLQDETIPVPSDLPCDKTQTVPVSIKTENLGGRKRRVSGSINISASLDRVWHVLTSYSCVESYMPNIVKCTVQMRNGVVHLDQVAIISRKLMLRTRMLLRVTENHPEHTLTFTRVEGRDFSAFEGIFFIREQSDGQIRLEYQLVAVPFPLFPMYLVERKIVKEVPRMLASVRQEAIQGKNIPFTETQTF